MSYVIGWRSLRYVAPNLSKGQARSIAAALGDAFHAYGITNRRRAAAAIAQFAHESNGFRTATEYATGAEYEGRRDLGNTMPGDGRRYKGRGYIQITGRSNYAALTRAFGHDFIHHPNDLALTHWAAKASAWWWADHGLSHLADEGRFIAITRTINGGTNGLASREAYWRRARRVSRWLTPRRAT